MPKPDRMSYLEAVVRQREGLPEPVKRPNRKRIDRELDRIEERVNELLRRLGIE